MICVLSADGSTTGIIQTVIVFACCKEHCEIEEDMNIINLKQLKKEVI